jgi:hypothetical protein
MARHSRNIDNTNPALAGPVSGGLRTLVRFEREDLLVRMTLTDPVSGNEVKLPLDKGGHRVGINIQEAVVSEFIPPPTSIDPKAKGYYVRKLRPDASCFLPAEKRVEGEPTKILRESLLTGGAFLADSDDVVHVTKQSSVSISTVALKLAIAMEGGFEEARNRIADLAADAWKKDIKRALLLFQLIKSSPEKRIPEDEIPQELKATATISQEIESKILKSACLWFGIDPESPLPKARPGKRARRKPRNYFDDAAPVEEESQEGEFILLTLRGESLRAALTNEFNGIPKGTDLASLSMLSLVELLGAFKEQDLETDAELLEAYLNASWPSWQERIGGMEGATGSSIDPWEILGVRQGASKEEIKQAYRKVQMAVHPDRSGLPSYFSIMASQAYKQLISEGI